MCVPETPFFCGDTSTCEGNVKRKCVKDFLWKWKSCAQGHVYLCMVCLVAKDKDEWRPYNVKQQINRPIKKRKKKEKKKGKTWKLRGEHRKLAGSMHEMTKLPPSFQSYKSYKINLSWSIWAWIWWNHMMNAQLLCNEEKSMEPASFQSSSAL